MAIRRLGELNLLRLDIIPLLKVFQVRAGVGSVMCSYNQINNSYACENSYVLNKLLKSELGFQGFGEYLIINDLGG